MQRTGRARVLAHVSPLDSKEVLLAGLDPITWAKRPLEKRIANEGVVVVKNVPPTYRISLLEQNRRNGIKDPVNIVSAQFRGQKEALKFATEPCLPGVFLQPPLNTVECRIVEWQRRYHQPRKLQELADAAIAEVEASELRAKEEAALAGPVVDSEGFTLVSGPMTKSSCGIVVESFNPVPCQKQSSRFVTSTNLSLVGTPQANQRKRKGGQEDDFYRFQLKEKRQQEYIALKKQYEEDTRIVETMQKAKRYKQF